MKLDRRAFLYGLVGMTLSARQDQIKKWLSVNTPIVDDPGELAAGVIGILRHFGPFSNRADYFVPIMDGKILCRMIPWYHNPERKSPMPWLNSPYVEIELTGVAEYLNEPHDPVWAWLSPADLRAANEADAA